MATVVEGFGLRDIARAVTDELQLTSDEFVSVSQVTVMVTYSVSRQTDGPDDEFVDEWYRSYLDRLDNEGVTF
jgi:hypothetical protein